MQDNRGKLIAAILAMLGVLCCCIGLIAAAVHYGNQPDAAVGTPPGSSFMDRALTGISHEGQDALAMAQGEEPEPRTVNAPMPETTYDADAPDTYDGSVDIEAAAANLAGEPDQLIAPTEGIQVGYSPSHVENGALVLPDAPATVWYDQTSPLGDPGASLIAGHVNYTDLSLSPFSQIAGLSKGSPILVTDDAGQVHEYKVESLQVYDQQELPQDLFSADGPDKLSLVTCSGASISTGGAWAYEYNLVVTATAV